ncbi:ankyrin-1-like [Trichogramma pretiosum]|uniref:ankyrin-1-like n=1 Tax=Trichogramma pretiosum TaxID=7493 RepID=UPI0006C9D203|nr:ankyrin-1-like [Trichogramma pretiosum]
MCDDDYNKFFIDFSNFDCFNENFDSEAGQEKLERLKSMREQVNWKIERERHEFYRQLCGLISDWKGQLPDLREIFAREEIEWLLTRSVDVRSTEFIRFVIRTGYKDEPDLDDDGKPLLCRVTPLHNAVRYPLNTRRLGFLVRALFIIYDRFDVNYTTESGLSHFHVACITGLEPIVKKFFKFGQDNKCLVQETGISPLHLAVCHGHKKVARWLLSCVNETGSTSLHLPCHRPDNDSANALLESSYKKYQLVHINAQDKSGRTPLHWALHKDAKNMVEWLLRKGADPNLPDKNGSTPLHVICKRICFMWSMTDIKNYDWVENTVQSGIRWKISREEVEHDKIMELFLQKIDEMQLTVKLDAVDHKGSTPIYYALRFGKHRIVEVLLRRGVDVNLANEEGLTPLHLICSFNVHFLETLFQINDEIQQTVQVNAVDNNGKTPLHYAVIRGSKQIAEALLRRGADPTLVTANGSSLLHFFCQSRYNAELEELLFNDDKQQMVQIDAKDKLGNTPLHLAAANFEDTRQIEYLLRRGANPNIANAEGLTPLHIICCGKLDDDRIKLFFKITDDIQQVVQVDARDKLGRTPLQCAVASLWPNTVQVLLDRGADLSIFVFPTMEHFDETFCKEYSYNDKLKLASGALAVVECLENGGYDLKRSDTLPIIEFFIKYELFENSSDLEKSFYSEEEFTSAAKEITIIPNLSLYDLVQLRPEEEEKLLTYMDYFKIESYHYWNLIRINYWYMCVGHLCEKMSRGYFQRLALDPLRELTRDRFPILCYEEIIQKLKNEDLLRICQAAEILAKEKEAKTCETVYKGEEIEKP